MTRSGEAPPSYLCLSWRLNDCKKYDQRPATWVLSA